MVIGRIEKGPLDRGSPARHRTYRRSRSPSVPDLPLCSARSAISPKSWERAGRCLALGIGLVAVLVGCAGEDLRQEAGPELAAETQAALTKTVDAEASLDTVLGLVSAQTSSRDECGIVGDRPLGGQETDPRQYTCSVMTSRAYISGPGETPPALSPQLNESLTERGCIISTEWDPPLNTDPSSLSQSVIADARYTCGEADLYVAVTAAQPDIVEPAVNTAQWVFSATGSPVREDPPLNYQALTDQATVTDSAVVLISAQAVYLDVQVCGDIYLCHEQPNQ